MGDHKRLGTSLAAGVLVVVGTLLSFCAFQQPCGASPNGELVLERPGRWMVNTGTALNTAGLVLFGLA